MKSDYSISPNALSGFADVENALSSRTELDKQVALQERNVELAEN